MKKSINTNQQSNKKPLFQNDRLLRNHTYNSSTQQKKYLKTKELNTANYEDEINTFHDFDNDLFINSPIQTIETQKSMTWCYSITPVHLKGLDIICKIFGRSRYTVKQWSKEGAPIVFDGISYISEYNALFGWLLDRYR